MREYEMRMRVFGFLKARMRNMIMPATVGIGLAVGGCAKEGSLQSNSSDAARDVTAVPVYSVVFPDSGPEVQPDGPGPDGPAPGHDLAVADTPEVQANADVAADLARDVVAAVDQGSGIDVSGSDVGKRDVAVGVDSGNDLGVIVTKYIAPIPDAAVDQGSIAPMYTAVMPDAAPDSGLPVRYAAVMPDAGADSGLAVLYMAPVQA